MASGNYAKKPVPSAARDERPYIPARATRMLSALPEEPEDEDIENITFSRDSASVRPLTTDKTKTPRNRSGSNTTSNTTRTPKTSNVTRMPGDASVPKTSTGPKTTKTTKTPTTTNVTSTASTTSATRAPKGTNTTRTPGSTKSTRTPANTNTATQTLNRRKAENNSTLILPETKAGRLTRSLPENEPERLTRSLPEGEPKRLTRSLPASEPKRLTRALTESEREHVTTVLPEMHEGNPTRVLPATQVIRAVNIDRALTHDVPLIQMDHHRPWLKPWLVCFVFAIICLFVLISAGIFQRPGTVSFYNSGQSYSIQVGGTQSKNWQETKPEPIKKNIPVATGPYAVLGAPTVTANFINKVLQAHNSPAAGKGQALYDLGKQYGIDPVFALAFFQHESSFGTAGEATKTRSLGNLRCYTGVTCVDTEIGGGYAQYATWEDGFTAWYSLIRNYYINVRGLTTVDLIIPVYAPTADHNDEAAYIASLKQEISGWHAGII